MTTPRDPDEILAAWLDEGPTRLPDQTRRAIVVALPTTSRRRHAWSGPWRFPIMTMTSKVAIGAVAVIAIVLGGVFLLRPGGSDAASAAARAPPRPPPRRRPSPTPSPTPVWRRRGVTHAGRAQRRSPTRGGRDLYGVDPFRPRCR